MESFLEAKQNFSAFLRDQNRPSVIKWVFKEDIMQIGGLTLFRILDAAGDEGLAERRYGNGLQKGLGVTLASQFYTDDFTAAYVWVPKTPDEAGDHLQGRGLKLLVLEKGADPKRFKDVQIKNDLLWWVVGKLPKKRKPFRGHLADIPSRSEIFILGLK